MENIFETIDKYIFNKGESTVIFDGKKTVTWSELIILIDKTCLGLSQSGLRAGRRALILTEISWKLPIIVLAIIKARAVVVPSDNSFGVKNIMEITKRSKPDIIIYDNKHKKIIELLKDTFSFRATINIDDKNETSNDNWESISTTDTEGAKFPETKQDTPAYHHYVISDDGKLQCFIASMKNLILSAYSAKQAFGFKESDRHLSLLPSGFRTFDLILRPLLSGGTIIIAATNNIKKIASAIEEFGVTIMQSPPYFWQFICQWKELTNNDFSSLRILESYGKTSKYIRKKAKKVIGENLIVTIAMGSTFGGYIGQDNHSLPNQINMNKPMPGFQGKINFENKFYPTLEQTGKFLIKSNIISIGRITKDGSRIMTNNNSWIETGQIARRTFDGGIELLGNSKPIIENNEKTIYLTEIENCLERHPEVIEAAVIKDIHNENNFKAFYKAQENSTIDKNTLSRHLQRRLPPEMTPTDIIKVKHFERFPTGQINKQKLI